MCILYFYCYDNMLKFSFCRYLQITFDTIYCVKAEQIGHLNYSGARTLTSKCCFLSGQGAKPVSNIKKRFILKQSKVIETKTKKLQPMSDSIQPHVDHASHGGQFQIIDLGESNSGQWQNQFGASRASSANRTSSVPCNFRVWEPVNGQDTSSGDTFKFRVVSYNVLAQCLLEFHPYLYTHCSPNNLKWKVRCPRLYEEIVNLAPDILCLQEVQETHLNSFYSIFENLGYFGIYKQKTGYKYDGCAIYFKQSMFNLEDQISVEFFQPDLPILNRDNIGIIVKLTPKTLPSSPIVVATTHLLYNPRRTDVRLAQMQLFLAEIDRFSYYNNGRESGHLPVILTGDMNSTPDSAVIQLLDNGNVSASTIRGESDWKRIGVTDNCQHLSVYFNQQKGLTTEFKQTKIFNTEYRQDQPFPTSETMAGPPNEYNELFNNTTICHPLDLRSVYAKVKPDGQYEATTFQDISWVMVDYIYFSRCSNLKLTERLRLPTALECSLLGRLPNDVYASDHLALAAAFQLKTPKSSL